MGYITAAYSDIGISKNTNEDSTLVLKARSGSTDLLMASVCDGMGGLSKGELASAEMVKDLTDWFSERLPFLLPGGIKHDLLEAEWRRVVASTNRRLGDYAAKHGIELGTTAVVLLLTGNDYYLLNVGDSRVYLLDDGIRQLTKDQTLVQREMDAGRMTPEQAQVSPNRGLLLQCIGASNIITPQFVTGTAKTGAVFLLCCDGFRHEVTTEELYQAFAPGGLTTKEVMGRKLKEITDLNIQRGENDNISSILVKLV